jgi:elongation factor Ts
MTEITSELIRAIRERTGAGMMDCKKALVECGGCFDDAVDWLRKKGLAAAANKASRAASDGAICVASADKTSAVMLEINSETDFVAKNVKFQEFALAMAEFAASTKSSQLDSFLELKRGDATVRDEVTSLIAIIGENITVRRLSRCEVECGVVATYIHSAIVPQLGKIGVLIGLESTGPHEKLTEFGKKLAMHIAASNPLFTTIGDVPENVVAHEREILLEQVSGQGKPAAVVDKMVEGRIRKFYEDTVLLEQVYVMDGKKKVTDVIADFSKEIAAPVSVSGFAKFVLGETTNVRAADGEEI